MVLLKFIPIVWNLLLFLCSWINFILHCDCARRGYFTKAFASHNIIISSTVGIAKCKKLYGYRYLIFCYIIELSTTTFYINSQVATNSYAKLFCGWFLCLNLSIKNISDVTFSCLSCRWHGVRWRLYLPAISLSRRSRTMMPTTITSRSITWIIAFIDVSINNGWGNIVMFVYV